MTNSPHASSARERALRQLCAEVFRDPRRVVQATNLAIANGFTLETHRHHDLLQMDLAVGCGGAWTCNARSLPVRGATTAVFYPGQEHSYALASRRPGAAVLSFKLRVNRRWEALGARIFPAYVPELAGEEPLARALRQVARLAAIENLRPPLLAVALSEALCLWPAGGGSTPIQPSAGEGGDPRIERALERIETRLARPPSLEELADMLNVSPRHLARRFRALLGCTPHDYLTARRLARAKELLAQGAFNVTQVAEVLGFPTIHTFSRWFRREAGLTPQDYRRKPGVL